MGKLDDRQAQGLAELLDEARSGLVDESVLLETFVTLFPDRMWPTSSWSSQHSKTPAYRYIAVPRA